MFDNVASMKESKAVNDKKRQSVPNLVAEAAEYVFADFPALPLPADIANSEGLKKRQSMVVGIPALLNMYLYAPFFNAYFRTLGVKDVVYSDVTSQKLWSEGNKFGTIDPCFPAKVAPAHTYNLLKKSDVTHICFPIITHLQSVVKNNLGNNACVIQMGTPEVVNAAFTRNRNYFKDFNKEYWRPLVKLDRPEEAEGTLFEYFKQRLDITEQENSFAVIQAYKAMETYYAAMRYKGKKIINSLVENDKIGILFIGHPYHHDPGLNHGIPEEFQLRGYPVLSIESLPVDSDFLAPLFSDITPVDGVAEDGLFDIKNTWVRNFNRNTNLKIWAANVAARHPNLAVIDLSSFKCGHDAPTYSYIENILDASSTPHFLFHDLDQNKPGATLKIRIESIDYFLKQEEIRLKKRVKELEDK
jgi:predicted nucleotide-binding protein (sugar kinase/HSP70/actin superfamily)